MIKLLSSPASPYSGKVRMAADYVGIPLEDVTVETGPQPPVLTSANPLGKIPCLVLDDGSGIFDSRVITQHLNRLSGGKLFPRNVEKRLAAEKLEALADGICDCLLAHVYERRMRPSEKVHQPWLDLQWSKAVRALGVLNAAPPKLPSRLTAGDIALRATLAYLDIRFAGLWEEANPKLRRWAQKFDAKFPSLAAQLPTAPR